MKNEEQFLDLIDTHFTVSNEFVKLGRGDDCAVLASGKDYCISSDLFIEDVHFRRSYFSAADIGYKALAVNISDIAGMGGKPVAFSMDLMAPADLDDEFWNKLFKSMSGIARQNDMALIGGDISRADKLGISITIYGVGSSTGFLQRGKCQPGDVLFTIGDIGLARAGLMTLEAFGDKAREALPAAVMAHLRPKPKVMIGTLLNAAGVNSLMDLSDGLARDLPRLLGPNQGADLSLKSEQLNGNVIAFAMGVGTDPLEIAILGGEDYALIGAVSPDKLDKAESVPGFTQIGTVSETPGITLNGEPFTTQGFDHFDD